MSLGFKRVGFSNPNLYYSATITAGSNNSISTTNQFGGGSLFANDPTATSTSTTTAVINVSSDWDFSADQTWTIEAWVRRVYGTGGFYPTPQWTILNINNNYKWNYVTFATTANNGLYTNVSGGSGPDANRQIPDDSWIHFAAVCDGSGGANNHKIYRNGVLVHTGTYATVGTDRTIEIGVVSNASAGGENLQMRWDEFRVSNNQRYTADFTPSASAFTTDANTLLLMHFDSTSSYNDFAF